MAKENRKSLPNGSYGDLGADFDRLFPDVDLLTKLEAKTLDEIFKPHGIKTVLDCAVGTGIQAIGLAQLGYIVSASDISRNMVQALHKKAQEKDLSIETRQSDFRNLRSWQGLQFDAVINCGHSLPFVADIGEVEDSLRSMASLTRNGGLVVVSVHNYKQLKERDEMFELKSKLTSDVGNEWIFDLREFGEQRVNVSHVFLRSQDGKLSMRRSTKSSLYLSPELLAESMRKTGLSNVEMQDVHGKPYQEGDWVFAVGEK